MLAVPFYPHSLFTTELIIRIIKIPPTVRALRLGSARVICLFGVEDANGYLAALLRLAPRIDSKFLRFLEPPDKPEVTYGEFPFTLIYEIDGETIIIEDTLVIRYKGVGSNKGIGKYNEWDRYLKSKMDKGYVVQSVRLFNGVLENGYSGPLSQKTLYNDYGIKIIKKELSSPTNIANDFTK